MPLADSRGRSAPPRRRLWAVAVAGITLALWVPRPAAADSATPLLVPASQAGPEQPEALDRAIRDALVEHEFDVVDGFALAKAALAQGAVPERDLLPFRRARRLLEEGWRSYLEVRAGFAAARLAEARTLALGVAHLEGGRELVAEISLRLAVVKLDLDRSAEAGDDFRLSHILAPTRAVTDAEFKPEAVAAYAAALAAPSVVHPRNLPAAPGMRLWINGSEVFGARARLSEGLHLLEAQAQGFHPRSKLVSVSPGEASPIELELQADPIAGRVLAGRQAIGLGRAESEARELVTAMLLYSQTDRLVLVASVWRRGAPALLGQQCSGRPARCSAVVEIGYPTGGLRVAATELWRTLDTSKRRFPPTLQVDSRLVSSETKPGETDTSKGGSLWSNRWLWVGAAAAAVAGGAVYILAQPGEGDSIFVGDRCEFGGC